MKCQFCGTINREGKDKCERCNRPLSGNVNNQMNITMSENNDKQTNRQPEHLLDPKSSIHPPVYKFNPKATVREASTDVNADAANPKVCPECGYELTDGACSSCGYRVKEEISKTESVNRVAVHARQTMRPIRKVEKGNAFALIPISEETGMQEGKSLDFEGESVMLNRDNTDPKNKTITSKEQAVITFENGRWCIEDRSEYRTTFVQIARKMELLKGDLILLGTQLYRFEG